MARLEVIRMQAYKPSFIGILTIFLMSTNFAFGASNAGTSQSESWESGNRSYNAHAVKTVFEQGDATYGIQKKGQTRVINNGPKIRYEVTYYQECSPAMTLIRACNANPDPPCADGSYPLTRIITAVNGPRAGTNVSARQYCTTEPTLEVPGAANDIAKVTLEQFRKMPLIASTIISQPENFSLRNGNAHLYASSKDQNFNIILFDQDVRVRAIPVTYAWKYGDGSTRSLTYSGGPITDHGFDEPTSTSHVYKETGDFRVGLTTSFRGEYSTEGGPWTPIPGLANVPSEQITMSVWRTKKILVADNCNQDPSGPGCSSPFEK